MGKSAVLTRGFAQVPNSFIEHLGLLTPAEMALGLLLFRRGGNAFAAGGVDVEISDETWQRWTGMKSRQKEYAIAGLREKFLSVEGRGEKAKLFFDPDRWRDFVKLQSAAEAEIRTKGRTKVVAVKSKPGMMIHPECESGGCQSLCAANEKPPSCLVPLPAVAKTPATKPLAPAAAASKAPTRELVSQPRGNRSARSWPLTIAAVTELFPTAGADFFARLVARSLNVDAKIDDGALASAVRACWQLKKSVQRSEGLFLSSVPDYLQHRRAVPISKARKHNCVDCSDTGYIEVGAPLDSDEVSIQKPCPRGCKPPVPIGSTA